MIEDCSRVIERGDFGFFGTVHAAALEIRGLTYHVRGNYAKAINDFTALVELDPEYSEGYYHRATALEKLDRLANALQDLDEAIRLMPSGSVRGSALMYNARARVLFKMGRAANGLPDASRAIELAPEFAEAYDTRAHIYEAIANDSAEVEYFHLAVVNYRKALELKPGLRESLDGLERMGLPLKDGEK